MSFSFLNVIYPFKVLSLFLNLEEGLLEEFLVLHLVTGWGVAWGGFGGTTSLIRILVMIFLLTTPYLLCGNSMEVVALLQLDL